MYLQSYCSKVHKCGVCFLFRYLCVTPFYSSTPSIIQRDLLYFFKVNSSATNKISDACTFLHLIKLLKTIKLKCFDSSGD